MLIVFVAVTTVVQHRFLSTTNITFVLTNTTVFALLALGGSSLLATCQRGSRRCLDSSGSVDVRAVINAYDMHDPFGLIDAVDHSVGPAACGVIAAQLAGKRLAYSVGVVQQWPGQEFGDCCSDL